MEVPYQKLKSDTLNRVIESFIVREGTEYGLHEVSMEEKIAKVKMQLKSNKIKILFSEKDQTINIVTLNEFKKYMAGQ